MEDEGSSENNINEKLENIKTIIKETKQQLTEKDESTETLKNIWYDEECKIVIQEMKKAREKLLKKERMENEEQEYVHKRKEVNKTIMNKKKLHIKKCNRINRRGSKE